MSFRTTFTLQICIFLSINYLIVAMPCFSSSSECLPLCGAACEPYHNDDSSIYCCPENFVQQIETTEAQSSYICSNDLNACPTGCDTCQVFEAESSMTLANCCSENIQPTNEQSSWQKQKQNSQRERSFLANKNRQLGGYYSGNGLASSCTGDCYSSSEMCTYACSSCNPCEGSYCCVLF